MKSFLELKKTKKVAQKLITIVLVQIYFNYKKNKLKLQGKNFLAFFSFFTQSFSLLDPDPNLGGKMNAKPFGSGSTALFLCKS